LTLLALILVSCSKSEEPEEAEKPGEQTELQPAIEQIDASSLPLFEVAVKSANVVSEIVREPLYTGGERSVWKARAGSGFLVVETQVRFSDCRVDAADLELPNPMPAPELPLPEAKTPEELSRKLQEQHRANAEYGAKVVTTDANLILPSGRRMEAIGGGSSGRTDLCVNCRIVASTICEDGASFEFFFVFPVPADVDLEKARLDFRREVLPLSPGR
jgi:hypothetical protein